MLYGEDKGAYKDEFINYKTEIKENCSEKYIFNLDETSLFLKNITRRSYFIDNEDNKSIKIEKTTINICWGKSWNPKELKF